MNLYLVFGYKPSPPIRDRDNGQTGAGDYADRFARQCLGAEPVAARGAMVGNLYGC